MSIKLELEPKDLDLVFVALQVAILPASFSQVRELIEKINAQGRPQLGQPVESPEGGEVLSAGGTD